MKFQLLPLAISLALAWAGPSERAGAGPATLLLVDITPAEALPQLAKLGVKQFGQTDNYCLVAPGPQAAAIMQAGLSLTTIPVQPDVPLYLVFLPADDRRPKVQQLVSLLIQDNGTIVAQLTEATALQVAIAGGELVRLPAKPFSIQLIPEPRLPRIMPRDTFVERLLAKVSPDSIHARMARLQAFRTRYSLTDSCRAAEQFVCDYFQSIGLDSVALDSYPVGADTWRNPIGTIVGRTHPEKLLIVCGHLDAISEDPWNLAPGMEDNGSGAAVTIEAARVLAHERLDLTVKFIGFTGEEEGLYRSDYSALTTPLVNNTGLVSGTIAGLMPQSPATLGS